MFLKLTTGANGDYRLIEVAEYSFRRHPTPVLTFHRFEPTPAGYILVSHHVGIEATVYVQNGNGKTIDTIQTDRKAP